MAKIEPFPEERTVTKGGMNIFGHGGNIEHKTSTDYNTHYSTQVEIAKINAVKEVQLAQIDADKVTKLAEIQAFKEIEVAKVTYQNNSAQSTVGSFSDQLPQIEAEKEPRLALSVRVSKTDPLLQLEQWLNE